MFEPSIFKMSKREKATYYIQWQIIVKGYIRKYESSLVSLIDRREDAEEEA